MRRSTAGATSIETSNNIFNEVLCQSMADLNMLMTETPQGRYPYAGIPWYSTTFGRDGLITALQMLWIDPRVARGVLRRLARLSGQRGRSAQRCRARQDPARDARRRDGGAARGAVRAILRQRRCDAAVRAARRALRRAHRRRRDAARSCGRRSRPRCAGSTVPAIPTATASSNISARPNRGLRNQGWKDSYDAIFHADGTLAEGNIALAEVQGYVFAAKRLAARCAQRLGRREIAQRLEAEAEQLAAALRGGVLVRGTRHLRAGARRRQAALHGAHLECRATAVQRHGARGPRAPGRGRSDAAAFLLRLGHPHRRAAARRATIRCPITTARSGRTTTR